MRRGVRLGGAFAALALVAALAAGAQAQAPPAATYRNPVIPGDYPDPSVVRDGPDYWAAATSSGWAPRFPILHSRDLVNWELAGAVLRGSARWAESGYWAPEIVRDGPRWLVLYTARRRNGPICSGVATARLPTGPYADRGPLVCQRYGSIDPSAVRDAAGRLHLVWKEDGNNFRRPSVIWAQQLSPGRTRLVGRRTALLRNRSRWEGPVVEAPFVVRRGEFFYLLYSGSYCCGPGCRYALGVARARSLHARFERRGANPILAGNSTWRCPGHGSLVSDPTGRDFLLYHGYRSGSLGLGRQVLLDEVAWSAGGWPEINGGRGVSSRALSPLGVDQRTGDGSFLDEFASSRLTLGWQWREHRRPRLRLDSETGGRLTLGASRAPPEDPAGVVLARVATVPDFVATAALDPRRSARSGLAGLAVFRHGRRVRGIAVGRRGVFAWRREGRRLDLLRVGRAPAGRVILLRVSAERARRFRFAYSADGVTWTAARGGELPQTGGGEGLRVALTAGGTLRPSATFEWLRLGRP